MWIMWTIYKYTSLHTIFYIGLDNLEKYGLSRENWFLHSQCLNNQKRVNVNFCFVKLSLNLRLYITYNSVKNQHVFGLSLGFPCSSDSKEFAYSAGDPASIPGLGRSPEERNGNPLQYPCLENLLDRGAWWAAVHGCAKNWAWLSD